jgi:hypothetical protein
MHLILILIETSEYCLLQNKSSLIKFGKLIPSVCIFHISLITRCPKLIYDPRCARDIYQFEVTRYQWNMYYRTNVSYVLTFLVKAVLAKYGNSYMSTYIEHLRIWIPVKVYPDLVVLNQFNIIFEIISI